MCECYWNTSDAKRTKDIISNSFAIQCKICNSVQKQILKGTRKPIEIDKMQLYAIFTKNSINFCLSVDDNKLYSGEHAGYNTLVACW